MASPVYAEDVAAAALAIEVTTYIRAMLRSAALTCVFLLMSCGAGAQSSGLGSQAIGPSSDWTAGLRQEVSEIGKTSWRPMLAYDVEMHRLSTHPAEHPFEFPWEDTGRGYGYGPGFGHWDVVHEILDVLPLAPEHARDELLNDVRLQLPSGFLPGLYWMRKQMPGGDATIYGTAGERYSPSGSGARSRMAFCIWTL